MSGSDTFYAPAPRATSFELARQSRLVDTSPILRDMLELVPDLLLLLNPQRQVIYANSILLSAFGVHPVDALGLRPGEILGCRVAETAPSGCGTGRECRNCSAIAVILAGLKGHRAEREARFDLANGTEFDARVRAHPVDWGGETFVGVSLTDVRAEVRRRRLGRMLEALGDVEGMDPASADEEIVARVMELLRSDAGGQGPDRLLGFDHVPVGDIVYGAVEHARGRLRELLVSTQTECEEGDTVWTSLDLMVDALSALLVYAASKSPSRLPVRISGSGGVAVCHISVEWDGYIPLDQQILVFAPPGTADDASALGPVRDLVEGALDGVLSFSSSPGDGTRFRVTLHRDQV